jgi:tripartite-type tricarboxylate transporter receptor subunit TctC
MSAFPVRFLWIVCASALLSGLLASAGMAEPYYKDKRLTVLINFAPGGPTDIEGRLFAKYIGKHIEGHPHVITQNMPGAGGITGTVHLGRLAPKDGSVVGYLTGAAWQAVSEPEKFPVDFKTYEFVAYQPGTTVYFMRTDIPPGTKTATDIAKATHIVAGGLTAGSTKDLRIRMTLDMLGVPYKYVTGYGSNQPARLAFERGEINFFAESPPAYLGVVEPTLVKEGTATPVFYDTGYNGESIIVPKQVAGLPILAFHELYKKVKGQMPSGALWEAYLSVNSVNNAMQRMVVLPPETPQAAVEALRAAVRRLNQDKEFTAEALKSVGFEIDYEAGPDTNKQVRAALAMPPETKTFLDTYMKNSPRR